MSYDDLSTVRFRVDAAQATLRQPVRLSLLGTEKSPALHATPRFFCASCNTTEPWRDNVGTDWKERVLNGSSIPCGNVSCSGYMTYNRDATPSTVEEEKPVEEKPVPLATVVETSVRVKRLAELRVKYNRTLGTVFHYGDYYGREWAWGIF